MKPNHSQGESQDTSLDRHEYEQTEPTDLAPELFEPADQSSPIEGVEVSEPQNLDFPGLGLSGKPMHPEQTTADPTEQIISLLGLLKEDIQSIQQRFDSKIKYDTSKERTIDSLHRELETHREGLQFKIMRPLFFDLIGMHDDITRILRYHKNREDHDEEGTRIFESMATFQDSIESILERHGVIAFNEPDDQFNPKSQRAMKTESTDDPTKDSLVAERLRKGFNYEGQVLRPETVSVYKFTATPNPDNTTQEV
jgi:molecular chaperone GrpE